ncbi:mitogen-activated protein kinase kinase kinase 2-like [Tubulanus polymorphus]|uniref:mitogen-activated protein kinase kinase kinase 2-like n=1 Tax=Tubulanus polymorphus TaxID=672921 RepID=UPI003DA3C789
MDPPDIEVWNDIKDGLTKGLRQAGGHRRNKEVGHGIHNEMRIKCEYLEERRIIQVPVPVKYDELLSKVKQYYGSALGMHYTISDGECYIPIKGQHELEQAVNLWEKGDHKRSLRIHLSRDEVNSNNSPTPPGKLGELFSTTYEGRSIGTTHDRYSPPPGSIPAHEEGHLCPSSSFTTSEGEFIPEHSETVRSHNDHPLADSNDSSLSGSRNSLDSSYVSNLGDTYPMRRKNSGRSATSDTAYEDPKAQEREYSKGGTYPTRLRPTTTKDREGSKTFPRGWGRNLEQGTFYSPTVGSERSLSTSSSSSGLAQDFDSPDGRRKKETPRAPVNWKKGKLLGAGAFGQVFLCYDVDSGRELGVKQVAIGAMSADISKEVRALESEIQLLKNLQHERIVQYFGTQSDKSYLSIFMEYMPGGSVKDELQSYGALTENVTRKYTSQVLQGIVYLHKHMIVHRDIKGANILRDSSGNVKLGDFGASKRLHTICTSSNIKSVTGTPYYMSPEVIGGEGYGRKADVWSLGCTVVEMLTKSPPWADFEAMAAIFKIATADHPKYTLPDYVSDIAKAFLQLTFIKSAHERPTTEQLLCHRFCNEFT